MKQKKIARMHTAFLLLCIITSLILHVRADEEYNVLATLQSIYPTNGGKFGGDIALSEDLLMIGEWLGLVDGETVGRAYIYDSNWNLILNLTSLTPQVTDQFGHSVDILDDIGVVGNLNAQQGNLSYAGEAQVFDNYGSPLYTLQSPQLKAYGFLGGAVAVGKDIILVAESGATVQGLPYSGNVHVFDFEGVYMTTLSSPSTKTHGRFGWSLDASDEFIIVGEPGNMGTGKPLTKGSVHVFDYDWNLVTTINVPEQGEQSYFGFSVSISDDIVVIGEIWADVDGHEKAGRAYIFDTGWTHLATLQAPVPEAIGEFGISVAVEGDLVVVGEFKGDVEVMNEGKAYVFDLEGNLISTLVSPEPTIGAQFGWRVDTNGEIVVVAEAEATVGGEKKAGKVHVFGLGEPAIEQPVPEEETTETESESESEKSGGIPGFPLESIVLSIALAVLVLWLIQRKR